jgi:putative glutamine amidotransferase
VLGHVATRHELRGRITGSVNSFHEFALLDCPEGFTVLAESSDGMIEAIGHNYLPWEGWMWHPEREPQLSARDVQCLKELLHAYNKSKH